MNAHRQPSADREGEVPREAGIARGNLCALTSTGGAGPSSA